MRLKYSACAAVVFMVSTVVLTRGAAGAAAGATPRRPANRPARSRRPADVKGGAGPSPAPSRRSSGRQAMRR